MVQRKQRVKVWTLWREVVVEVWMNVVSWDRSSSSVKGFIKCVNAKKRLRRYIFEYLHMFWLENYRYQVREFHKKKIMSFESLLENRWGVGGLRVHSEQIMCNLTGRGGYITYLQRSNKNEIYSRDLHQIRIRVKPLCCSDPGIPLSTHPARRRNWTKETWIFGRSRGGWGATSRWELLMIRHQPRPSLVNMCLPRRRLVVLYIFSRAYRVKVYAWSAAPRK